MSVPNSVSEGTNWEVEGSKFFSEIEQSERSEVEAIIEELEDKLDTSKMSTYTPPTYTPSEIIPPSVEEPTLEEQPVKRRFDEYAIIPLTEMCSEMMRMKSPTELNVSGKFSIPLTFGTSICMDAICDLGSCANFMPLYVFDKLGLGDLKMSNMTLKLFNKSIAYPWGVIDNVLVKVDEFILPMDFIVLDIEEDNGMPIILGQPFLDIGRTLVDEEKGELIIRVLDKQISFTIDTHDASSHEVVEITTVGCDESIDLMLGPICHDDIVDTCHVGLHSNEKDRLIYCTPTLDYSFPSSDDEPYVLFVPQIQFIKHVVRWDISLVLNFIMVDSNYIYDPGGLGCYMV